MNKRQRSIVLKTAGYAERTLGRDATGHDWLHVLRVWRNARAIGRTVKADMFVVELAALLHDIADWKFHNGDRTVGVRKAARWLRKMGVAPEVVEHVGSIIDKASFKGAKVENAIDTPEGRVVQDADRLDALGAIGIARTFAYGGAKGREIYNPRSRPVMHTSARAYSKSAGPTINHFYEKLLLLKDKMNTAAGKRMAQSRHKFMLEFLHRFHRETGRSPSR